MSYFATHKYASIQNGPTGFACSTFHSSFSLLFTVINTSVALLWKNFAPFSPSENEILRALVIIHWPIITIPSTQNICVWAVFFASVGRASTNTNYRNGVNDSHILEEKKNKDESATYFLDTSNHLTHYRLHRVWDIRPFLNDVQTKNICFIYLTQYRMAKGTFTAHQLPFLT